MKKRKKYILLWSSGLFLCGAALVLLLVLSMNVRNQGERDTLKMGISLYKQSDTFITSIADAIEAYAKKYEFENKVRIQLDISDAKESQREQDKQIERYIALDYDVICVNLVDRTSAATIIDKASQKDIPLVFFNREPVEEDIFRGEKVYYVGTDARESAVLEGGIITGLYEKDPSLVDLNGNGVVDYVMLEGEMGHQDTIIRTEWSIKSLKEAGVPLEKVDGGIANFERSQAEALMEQWLLSYPDQIELVICNNDDMALGACDAMEKLEISRTVKVVGIDGTKEGLKAVQEGRMAGTVVCNSNSQANAIFRLAYAVAATGHLPKELELENERYVRVPLEQVTTADLKRN